MNLANDKGVLWPLLPLPAGHSIAHTSTNGRHWHPHNDLHLFRHFVAVKTGSVRIVEQTEQSVRFLYSADAIDEKFRRWHWFHQPRRFQNPRHSILPSHNCADLQCNYDGYRTQVKKNLCRNENNSAARRATGTFQPLRKYHQTRLPPAALRRSRRDNARPGVLVFGPRTGATPYRVLSNPYVANATTAPMNAGITNPNNKVSMRRIVHGAGPTCNSIAFPNV